MVAFVWEALHVLNSLKVIYCLNCLLSLKYSMLYCDLFLSDKSFVGYEAQPDTRSRSVGVCLKVVHNQNLYSKGDKWKSILVCHECCSLSINILPHCCLLQINGEHTAYKKFAANMANQMLTIAFRCDCCIHCHLQCRAIKNTLVLWPSSCSLFTKGENSNSGPRSKSRSKEFGIGGQAKSFSRFHSHQTHMQLQSF